VRNFPQADQLGQTAVKGAGLAALVVQTQSRCASSRLSIGEDANSVLMTSKPLERGYLLFEVKIRKRVEG